MEPSTQTLIQALPPWIEMTRFMLLNSTVTVRVSDAVLSWSDVAVIVIAHTPVPSSSGVVKLPSSPTGTVVPSGGELEAGRVLEPGAGDGAGLGKRLGAGVAAAPTAPRNLAATVTLVALVAIP